MVLNDERKMLPGNCTAVHYKANPKQGNCASLARFAGGTRTAQDVSYFDIKTYVIPKTHTS